jgi:hypothetical protein
MRLEKTCNQVFTEFTLELFIGVFCAGSFQAVYQLTLKTN